MRGDDWHVGGLVVHCVESQPLDDGLVVNLTSGVEALIQDVWPDDFTHTPKDRRGIVSNILRKKRDSTNSAERKFAHVAACLFHEYRNESVHARNIRSTTDEALFVYAACRLLAVLHSQLKASRK